MFVEEVFVWGEYEIWVQMFNFKFLVELNCCVYGVEDDCILMIWMNSLKLFNDVIVVIVKLGKDSFWRRFLKDIVIDQMEFCMLLNGRG